ncbi:MAG: GntR family transcriptional regulator [Microbacterium sp.]
MTGKGTPTTAAHELYSALRAEFIRGEFIQGQRLKLDTLTQRLNVSRTVAREALMRLVGEGIVTFNPQRGFTVENMTPEEFVDLTHARMIVEGGAFRDSIRRGGITWESEVLAAFHVLDRTPFALHNAGNGRSWPEVHDRFHATLLAGSGNHTIAGIALRLRERAQLYPGWYEQAGNPAARDTSAEHRRLADLALTGDEDAAVAALTDHIALSTRLLLERQGFELDENLMITADPDRADRTQNA